MNTARAVEAERRLRYAIEFIEILARHHHNDALREAAPVIVSYLTAQPKQDEPS